MTTPHEADRLAEKIKAALDRGMPLCAAFEAIDRLAALAKQRVPTLTPVGAGDGHTYAVHAETMSRALHPSWYSPNLNATAKQPAPRDSEFERGYLAGLKQAKEQAEIAAACAFAEQPAQAPMKLNAFQERTALLDTHGDMTNQPRLTSQDAAWIGWQSRGALANGLAHGPLDMSVSDEWLIAKAAAERAQSPPAPVERPSPTGRRHDLKTDPEVFDAVAAGLKTFEIRFNDRGFKVGDRLRLRRTTNTGDEMAAGAPLVFSGEEVSRLVSHVFSGPMYGLVDGWVILSLTPAAGQQEGDKVGALALAIKFHETYERLAPAFGYETRSDTKVFDPESKNGRLMVAVCAAIASSKGSAAP